MENYLTKINEVVEKDIIPLENDFLLHGFSLGFFPSR